MSYKLGFILSQESFDLLDCNVERCYGSNDAQGQFCTGHREAEIPRNWLKSEFSVRGPVRWLSVAYILTNMGAKIHPYIWTHSASLIITTYISIRGAKRYEVFS